MDDRVFTGDTLLISGTGRCDFQNGDPYEQYHSLFERLLKLPDQTMVFPAHDYKGDTVSTIGEEKMFNPRLKVSSAEEYAEIMNNLNLPNPKMMDVAVPENLKLGLRLDAQYRVPAVEVEELLSTWPDVDGQLIDIREDSERERDGAIPNSMHLPYGQFETYCEATGPLTIAWGRIRACCSIVQSERRSTLAVEIADEHGIKNIAHVPGGFREWKAEGGPVEKID